VRLGAALAAMLLLAGCASEDLVLIPGTTTRASSVTQAKGTELGMRIFREPRECIGAGIAGNIDDTERLSMCLPHVDRRSGEVRLGFQLRDKRDETVALPLTQEDLTVIHQGTLIQDGASGQALTVIPHDPMDVDQLFVLLIDGSSSMAEMASRRRTRMEQVKQALRLREVQDAFFPKEVKTAVLLMQFTSGDPRPVGGEILPLENRRAYLAAVDQLQVLSGFTHLYGAVGWATGSMLKNDQIQRLIDDNSMEVTVIALTDGFNNMEGRDTCRTNAPRLEALLEQLTELKASGGVRLGRQARIFTVGLGRPVRPGFELPDDWNQKVRPRDLCGRFADQRIDGDLERRGIDNASLEWIAQAGDGQSFVKQGRDGLGDAFRSSAARRFSWFEARYRIDPFYLRRSFTTRLRLRSYYTGEASLKLHPSAWLDAPPGVAGEGGWTEPQTYRHTLVVLAPVIGLLIALGYLGAALFNTRRALFGRTRQRPPKS